LQRLPAFREDLYDFFPRRADATMNLIDAISCNSSATSPVELSLDPLFPRQYRSIFDAVGNFFVPEDPENKEKERAEHQCMIASIIAGHIPLPEHRPFYLIGMDATPEPRPFANTLKDRGIQYYPNPAPGNKPITVGHSYSVLAALPEKMDQGLAPWIIPILIRRIPTDRKATEVGAVQLNSIMKDKELPFGNNLSAFVGDSSYSVREFLGETVCHENLTSIIRVRGNRTFYHQPVQEDTVYSEGHPKWYGEPFKMKDPETWGNPDNLKNKTYTLRNGRIVDVEIKAWNDLIMRGKIGIPMHKHPFTLIRIAVKDEDEGRKVFKRPLWLIIIGERRHEISLIDAYESYRQRYDLEHFFRFGKNKLLMASYQTPEVEHEENWWEIVGLAYNQLYLAAHLAESFPRPWEIYLPEFKSHRPGKLQSPTIVQRDMPRILDQVGTPAKPPKHRGKAPGRIIGYSPGKRERQPIVIKSHKPFENKAEARCP
jgi:hypothetical protein